VTDEGFYVWTKGLDSRGNPVEGRYIAFSGSLDLPGAGFLAALREKLVWPEFVGELREKFAYEDSVIR
jgi:hypothetical protein